MPTYEYKCDACGHRFEKFHSITAKPIRKCPKCGKLKVKRLIGTGAGMIFKGSGFYITDYRSEGYKNAAKADSGGAAETTSSSSDGKKESTAPAAAKESKPAAKSEAAATSKSSKSSESKKSQNP